MAGNFQVISHEWRGQSRELAEWAMQHLVNRRDVWGQYTVLSEKEKRENKKKYKALTLPQKSKRGQDMVSLEKLTRHFSSTRRNHLIGLHTTSLENTSRWLAIDIDLHDAEAVDADDLARRNERAAVTWWEQLQLRGYDPILMDSNGRGGYHLWVLFAEPAPTADVYAMAQNLVADWEKQNLDELPETFPKNAGNKSIDKLGAWLRLPGMHHTFEHFTRIWSGEPWLDEPWLEGQSAIDLLLNNQPGPPPPHSSGEVRIPKPTAPKKRTHIPSSRPQVCVDLDGVLASYDGQAGETIGAPVDGAIEFMQELHEIAEITVYTSRIDREKLDTSMARVQSWLDSHGFAFDHIYAGAGKPRAVAYIDDRAISCRPQENGPLAFASALSWVKLLNRQDLAEDRAFLNLCRRWPELSDNQRQSILEILDT